MGAGEVGPSASRRQIMRQRQAAHLQRRAESEMSRLSQPVKATVCGDLQFADALLDEWEKCTSSAPVRRLSGSTLEDLVWKFPVTLKPTPSAPVVLVPGGEVLLGVIILKEPPSLEFLDWISHWQEAGGLLVSNDRSTFCLLTWEDDERVFEALILDRAGELTDQKEE